ncbi:alcohol dehydrogenase-related 31 kDa protein-like isoform X2 [Sitodiplosis mosellana]|uniref:alcohol dehydrogenase-related 31 kDa protein-like isoform X2 n=1 Tax=Sitodiplosis mosellana TaxID=263140 RepID=UPI002444E2EE|nr:alcohol dehydrogenase-related 31 kDa protein-like isoform X2 [Sitodiplosis mosellana]
MIDYKRGCITVGMISLLKAISPSSEFHEMKFEEQSFVVVGAARTGGIGLNFVRELLAIGVEKIAVFDVADPSEINKLKMQFGDKAILFHKVDVRNKTEIETAFKEVVMTFGYVDVLANIVGICDETKIEDTIHCGMIYSTLIGIDQMSVKNGGHGGMIVNVASVAGLDPFHRCPVYSSSKSGVVAFTRSLSDKILTSEFGIKFVLICPGSTKTELLKDTLPKMFGTYDGGEEYNRIMAEYGSQTAEECAKSMIQALKESENGSTWILDRAKHTAVNFCQYYQMD